MTSSVGKTASRSRVYKVNQECEMWNWNLKIAVIVECIRSTQNIDVSTISSEHGSDT